MRQTLRLLAAALVAATAAAQSYVVRAWLPQQREFEMRQSGGPPWSARLHGFFPHANFEFEIVDVANSTVFPPTHVNATLDAMGACTISFAPGAASGSGFPTSDVVAYTPSAAHGWEVFGSFHNWNASVDPLGRRMTYQGGGSWMVEYVVTSVGNHQFKLRRENSSATSVGADFGNNAAPATFATTVANQVVRFTLDVNDGRVRVQALNQTRRYVDPAVAGGDGRTWARAYAHLQAALAEKSANPAAVTEIWVAAGVYRPLFETEVGNPRSRTFALPTSNLALYGGLTPGTLDLLRRRPLVDVSILDGDINGNDPSAPLTGATLPPQMNDNCYHVISASGIASSVVLDGFRVRNGAATGGTTARQQGAGLYADTGTVTVRNCVFIRNWAEGEGGALYVADGATNLDSSKILGNVARLGSGGGVRIERGSATLSSDVLCGNRGVTSGTIGGGLHANLATVLLGGCTFAANQAGAGGGLASNTNLTGSTSLFWGNTALSGTPESWQLFRIGNPLFTLSYNLVQNWTGALSADPTNAGADPRFVSVAGIDGVAGTLDDDLKLRIDSPAIDSGANAGVNPTRPDADGYARRWDAPHIGDSGQGARPLVDRGALEFRPWLLVDDSAQPGGDGRTWPTALSSLQSAIDAVNAAAGAYSAIWVASGAYVPSLVSVPGNARSVTFALPNGCTIRGGFLGVEHAIPSDHNPGFAPSVLSGDALGDDLPGFANRGDNAYHVVSAAIAGLTATLDGFIVEAGHADGATGTFPFGGGVHVGGAAAAPIVNRCLLRDNYAVGRGAGAYVVPGASPRFSTAAFVENRCPGAGSGLYTSGAASGDLLHLAFRRNECSGVEAGALAALSVADLYLGASEFSDNAGSTAAIDVLGDSAAATLTLDSVIVDELAAAGSAVRLRQCSVTLAGTTSFTAGDLHFRTVDVQPGQPIHLGDLVKLNIYNDAGDRPAPQSTISTAIVGTGDIHVRRGQTLLLDAACVDLSGDALCGGCAGISSADDWGDVIIDGTLRVLDSALQNCDIAVNNKVTIATCGNSLGGRFYAEDGAEITCNRITAQGDRYLDVRAGATPLDLSGNTIYIRIDSDPSRPEGELFQARSPDGAGFTDQWTLEELELKPGAKLNVVYRDGFEQLGPGRTLLVRNLKLGAGAILNTSPDTTLDYLALISGSAAQILDLPLLGFRLETIGMDDDCEFEVRIDPRELGENGQPGLVRRIDSAALATGVMEMSTQAASSVAAKGTFASAGESRVVIQFKYQFTNVAPTTRLNIYLSDEPGVGVARVLKAYIKPPAAARPGGVASGRLAEFYGVFPATGFEFDDGTYIELELAGTNSRVLIDEFDPYVTCASPECADYNGNRVSYEIDDYLVALAALGNDLSGAAGVDLGCFDRDGPGDRYVDVTDQLMQDAVFSAADCDLPSLAPNTITARTLPSSGVAVAGIPANPDMAQPMQLYLFTAAGESAGDPVLPAGPATPSGRQRGYGRLLRTPAGQVCQLHATQNLMNVEAGTARLAPLAAGLSYSGNTVYVGPTDVAGTPYGAPLADAAFDPADVTVLYVTPVQVDPPGVTPNYWATAALDVTNPAAPVVLRLFGQDPSVVSAGVLVDAAGQMVFEPDVYRPRELEIDADGNLYVVAAHAVNDNDWLLVFDAAGDAIAELTIDLSSAAPAPTALLVPSSDPASLYVASAANPSATQTAVERYQITRGGTGLVTSIAHASTVQIDHDDMGWSTGQKSLVTSICESGDGEIVAVGVLSPVYASIAEIDFSGDVYTRAFFAAIPTSGLVSSQALDAPDDDSLVLSVSAIGLGPLGPPCAEDVNGDGQRDLTDLAILLSHFGTLSGAAHGDGDLDGDGDVDITDLATLLAVFGSRCP